MMGLAPLLLATGPGSEIQGPLATVVIGGLFSSTVLTLIVLPVLYRWMEARVDRERAEQASVSAVESGLSERRVDRPTPL